MKIFCQTSEANGVQEALVGTQKDHKGTGKDDSRFKPRAPGKSRGRDGDPSIPTHQRTLHSVKDSYEKSMKPVGVILQVHGDNEKVVPWYDDGAR